MPAYVTHSLFGKDVYEAIDESKLKQILSDYKIAYEWGLQGPDLLFFYGMLPPRPNHNLNRLGGVMHRIKADELFNTLTQYLSACKNHACYQNTFAYIMGFCCHYALDSIAHPYIYYRQQELKRILPKAEHRGIHHKVESDIDSEIYLVKTGKMINHFNIMKDLISDKKMQQDIAKLYEYVFLNVYDIKIDTTAIQKCFGDAYRIIRLVMGKPLALCFAKILDGLALKRNSLSAHVRRKKGDGDPLNLNKKPWYHLTNNSARTNITFLQLEQQALVKAMSMQNEIYNAVQDDILNPFAGLDSFDNGSL